MKLCLGTVFLPKRCDNGIAGIHRSGGRERHGAVAGARDVPRAGAGARAGGHTRARRARRRQRRLHRARQRHLRHCRRQS